MGKSSRNPDKAEKNAKKIAARKEEVKALKSAKVTDEDSKQSSTDPEDNPRDQEETLIKNLAESPIIYSPDFPDTQVATLAKEEDGTEEIQEEYVIVSELSAPKTTKTSSYFSGFMGAIWPQKADNHYHYPDGGPDVL